MTNLFEGKLFRGLTHSDPRPQKQKELDVYLSNNGIDGYEVGSINDLNFKKMYYQILGRSVELGHFGKISLVKYLGKPVKISDDVFINSDELLGSIDVFRNKQEYQNLDPVVALREILKDFLSGLIEISKDLEDGKFPPEFVAITGASHLLTKKIVDGMLKDLGFTITGLNNKGINYVSNVGKMFAIDSMKERGEKFTGNIEDIEKKLEKRKIAHEPCRIWMSTEKLAKPETREKIQALLDKFSRKSGNGSGVVAGDRKVIGK